jgi:hypothetical protein
MRARHTGVRFGCRKEALLQSVSNTLKTILGILLFPFIVHAGSGILAEKATPQEVYEKVVEAAAFLSKAGRDGLKEFEKRRGRFVWKDSYVWVTECDGIYCSLGPESQLSGLGISKVKCYKTGKFYVLVLCDRIKDNPNGAWVEYWWPKPGKDEPQRKVSFMMQVPGQPYQVVAGIFDEATMLEQLNRMSSKEKPKKAN